MKINKYNLEISVFLCGAVVMIYELVGARILGPYFGTSLFVWTSIIGIILASLSLGYYLGGKVADKKPALSNLSLVVFLSAFFIAFTLIIKEPLLNFFQASISDIKLNSFLVSIILFSPASILLGMISPYAAKIRLVNLDQSAATIGRLYALSTGGSIFGTFFSGFFLIPHFGTDKILIILSVTLVLISILLFKDSLKFKSGVIGMGIIGWLGLSYANSLAEAKGFIDKDTLYNRVWISDQRDPNSGEMVRSLSINNENSSAMYLDRDDLVYEYTKYYDLAKHFTPDFKTTLMLGGAAYSYPKHFLQTYPEATMDVVEIDPGVTALAKQYFRLKDDPRLKIYHEDGRVYLNQSQEKYDVIFGDAFSSQHSLPYQLTTQETVQRKYDLLNQNGVVVLNIISSVGGKKGEFLRAEYATYKSIFPQVHLFPVRDNTDPNHVQNIILVAIKSDQKATFEDADPILNQYLQQHWTQEIPQDMPILNDDFAPVEHMIGKTI